MPRWCSQANWSEKNVQACGAPATWDKKTKVWHVSVNVTPVQHLLFTYKDWNGWPRYDSSAIPRLKLDKVHLKFSNQQIATIAVPQTRLSQTRPETSKWGGYIEMSAAGPEQNIVESGMISRTCLIAGKGCYANTHAVFTRVHIFKFGISHNILTMHCLEWEIEICCCYGKCHVI